MVLQNLIEMFNNSPALAGISILLSNIGGRYLDMELTKDDDKFFQQPFIRRMIVFFISYVASRDVLVSIAITLGFVLLTKRTKLFE